MSASQLSLNPAAATAVRSVYILHLNAFDPGCPVVIPCHTLPELQLGRIFFVFPLP